MVRLNLSSDDISKYKETTTFVKKCGKVIACKKKGILNLGYKQRIVFEGIKEL